MRRRFIPLLFSIAGLGIVPSTVRCAVVPSVKESAFRTDAGLRYSPEVEEETRVLRQSLFKNPFLPLSEPKAQPAPPKRAPAAQPKSSAPKSRPLVIAPPPVPREILLAEKELLLEPAADTPYDPYSGSVRTVIAHLDQRPARAERSHHDRPSCLRRDARTHRDHGHRGTVLGPRGQRRCRVRQPLDRQVRPRDRDRRWGPQLLAHRGERRPC